MQSPFRYLYRSVTENERLSPRLATVFVFVAAAIMLLYHGATTPPKVEGGIILSAWPPEYIWSGVCLIIAGLLGLGKASDALVARAQIQADAAVATATATGQQPAPPAVVNAGSVTITPTTPSTPPASE